MDTVYIILSVIGSLLLLFAIYLLLIHPRFRRPEMIKQFLGRQYAHRGLHDLSNGIPENTLLAFGRAVERGYGMEFDVRFTKDKHLVIMHDDNVERMTGRKLLTSQSTLAELAGLRVGGTDEAIPRFEEVLALVDGRVPLIIELKVCGNDFAELGAAVCAVLDGYNGPYVIESFDPRLVNWLRKNRPDIVRGQLMEYYRRHGDKDFPAVLDLIIHSHIINSYSRPDFVAINHADRDTLPMRISRAVFNTPEFDWTVRSQAEADASREDGSGYIFEGFIPTAHN